MHCRTYQSNSLAESTRILGSEWSRHDILVERSSPFRMRFSTRTVTENMSISSLSYGTEARIRPADRAPVLLLYVPRSGSATASYGWGSVAIDSRHHALIDATRVSQVHCSMDLDVMVLRIALSRVAKGLEQALGRTPVGPVEFSPHISRGAAGWDAWVPVVASLQAIDSAPQQYAFSTEALLGFEQMVVGTLLFGQPHSHSESLAARAQGLAPRHVRRAEEYIHARLSEPLTASDIAGHAQVSVRALFNGFREFRQTTPADYVRQARLSAAREALMCGLPDVDGIAELALRCGYQHAGHFAAQYRRRYGESPVDTFRMRSRLN